MTRNRKPQPPPINDTTILNIIQFVIGFIIVAWGAYFLGPWEAYQYTVAPAQQYATEFIIGPWIAAFEISSGLGVMAGAILRNPTLSRYSLVGVVISYSLLVWLRLLTTGLFPFFWLFQFGLALVSMLLLLRSGLTDDAD